GLRRRSVDTICSPGWARRNHRLLQPLACLGGCRDCRPLLAIAVVGCYHITLCSAQIRKQGEGAMAGRFFGAGGAPAADTVAEPEESDASALPLHPPAQGEKRLALVIGNARYRAEPLANAAADATLIAKILPALGFETTRIEDASAEALRSGVIGFANAVALAGPGAVAIVYYAGHGIQLGDANYLLPIEVTAADLVAAEPKLMALSQVIALLSAARPKAAALI